MDNAIRTNFEKLVANRLLSSDEEVLLFEEALQFFVEEENPEHISLLCQAFDDDTEDYEVMFGLVHIIEAYDKKTSVETATTEFVKAIPSLLKRGEEWLEVLLIRILNDDTSRIVFAQVIGDADKTTRSTTLNKLKKIAKEDPEEFGDKVADLISNM